MGLGKTVQVLALSIRDMKRARRAMRSARRSSSCRGRSCSTGFARPSGSRRTFACSTTLAPDARSRVLDGGDVDIVITTYGTLRRDAADLADVRFDYAILDEAQAIKNAGSASAKAARLIARDHRIAMTGTPIENRIDELWSLFEFLNPGMLGAASAFSALAHDTSLDGREVLARVRCGRSCSGAQRNRSRRTCRPYRADAVGRARAGAAPVLYGLLESYRHSVLERVDKLGVGRSKMHILEALLRLRQAACHPALGRSDSDRAASAKVDALLPALEEIIAQGHKALVFSQFTSFLALVRARLDAAGVVYEYLDGRTFATGNRASIDSRRCELSALPYKSQGGRARAEPHRGGLRVPARSVVEPCGRGAGDRSRAPHRADAPSDRDTAHGADTIEEKILQLQASKRALADAILGQDQGVLARIGRAELELLLS